MKKDLIACELQEDNPLIIIFWLTSMSMYGGGTNQINQQRAPEHEMVLSTQAADAIPASARVSRDENGSEESNDEDDSEDEDNDNVNPVNDRNIYVPET